jgi:hypothetical protein
MKSASELVAEALQEDGEDITVEEVQAAYEELRPVLEEMLRTDPEFKAMYDRLCELASDTKLQ